MTFTGLKTKVRTIGFTNKWCRVFLKFAVAKLGSLFLRQFGRHFIISVGDGIVLSGNNGRHTVWMQTMLNLCSDQVTSRIFSQQQL